jgi:hypothetical protein
MALNALKKALDKKYRFLKLQVSNFCKKKERKMKKKKERKKEK